MTDIQLRFYSPDGILTDVRCVTAMSYALKLCRKYSKLSGFVCLELDGCKMRWWKKGKECVK